MPRPTVGVVITTFNYGRFIEECLRSLDTQTLSPSSVVVIDDASSDNTTDILRRVIPELSFGSRTTILRHDERRGLAASLNEGFAECAADFIAHVDADDRCLPRYLEALTER